MTLRSPASNSRFIETRVQFAKLDLKLLSFNKASFVSFASIFLSIRSMLTLSSCDKASPFNVISSFPSLMMMTGKDLSSYV